MQDFLFTFMEMKRVVPILLFVISFWGFIAFGLMVKNKSILDKWYIAIPSFILAIIWWYTFVTLAERYGKKN